MSRWRKSSRSNQNDACVEFATSATDDEHPELVAVRDSKDPHGPILTFGPDAWRNFIAAVKAGELDA